MTGASMRPFVIKEIRALLPTWLASICAIGAAALSGPRFHFLGVLAYGFGSVTLGAQSIGHEYTHRTLTLLLSQPWSRQRILLLKLAVLSTMSLTLATFAWLTMLKPGELQWVFLILLNGLVLAPLLTMACRSPLAGVVFSGAGPFWMSELAKVIGAGVVWAFALGGAIPAAVASWRLFIRLEAIDGRGSDLELPQMFRGTSAIGAASADPARPRHPVWLLVQKELHLQQMTFAVAAVSGMFWLTNFGITKIVPGYVGIPSHVISILYGALLALLIGSLAGAEERQIGTHEWQMLLPMAMWKQWAVKVGTTLGLAALLSFALPVALAPWQIGINGFHAGVIVILTTGSLYVSSLCRSTLRALVVSGALVLGLLLSSAAVAAIWPHAWSFTPLAALVVLVLLFALAMWFAFENHRSAEQGTGRVFRQVVWLAGCLAVGEAVAIAFP